MLWLTGATSLLWREFILSLLYLCSLQEQLSRHLEELQAERSKTEAHIQSLKKRNTDLSVSMDPDTADT